MPRITLYLLRKTDNTGLLIPPMIRGGGGNIRVLEENLEDPVYDKLLYFLFSTQEIMRNQPVFLNGEVVGYAATDIPRGNPIVYAEAVPSSWVNLWERARTLLSIDTYEEYPFQCTSMRSLGAHVACYIPGAERPVFIDRDVTRRIIGMDPVSATLPLFIGNITPTGSPMGLSGLNSYAPELIPYLAYLYRISGGSV
jgi:hypothetical protein